MVGWHHQVDRHEFEQAPRVGDGEESLASLPKLPAAPGGFHTERRREHGPDYTEKPGFRESVNGTWIHG